MGKQKQTPHAVIWDATRDLPSEPVLADFYAKSDEKPAAAGKGKKPKAAKVAAAQADGNVCGGGDCGTCNECEDD